MVRFKLCGAQTTAALWFWEHLWLFISFPPSFDHSNIISCPKIALPIHFQVCLKHIFKHLPKYSLETLLFMSDVLYAQHICLCCQTGFQFLQNFPINMHVILCGLHRHSGTFDNHLLQIVPFALASQFHYKVCALKNNGEWELLLVIRQEGWVISGRVAWK